MLVVDDNADNLELIQFILEQHNAQVTVATSVNQAFKVITLVKPQILISDIGMPYEDGYSLIRLIRNLTQPLSEIPAIALTAHASVEALNKALEAGFSTYLAKPFDPEELIAVVSNLAVRHSALCCQKN